MLARVVVIGLIASCARPAPRTMPPGSPAPEPHVDELGSIMGRVQANVPFGFCEDGMVSGLELAGVEVIVTSPALERPLRTVTDDRGVYKVARLPAGRYQVEFRHHASPRLSRDGVQVRLRRITPVFVRLQGSDALAPRCVHFATPVL